MSFLRSARRKSPWKRLSLVLVQTFALRNNFVRRLTRIHSHSSASDCEKSCKPKQQNRWKSCEKHTTYLNKQSCVRLDKWRHEGSVNHGQDYFSGENKVSISINLPHCIVIELFFSKYFFINQAKSEQRKKKSGLVFL